MKKLMRLLMITGMLAVPSLSQAADPWSKTDVALQAAYTVLHVVDWGQTHWISNNPTITHHESSSNPDGSATFSSWKTYRQEGNSILGKNPSKQKINAYFVSTLLLHTTISHFLPSKYRTAWQAVTISLEGLVVSKNIKAGVEFNF